MHKSVNIQTHTHPHTPTHTHTPTMKHKILSTSSTNASSCSHSLTFKYWHKQTLSCAESGDCWRRIERVRKEQLRKTHTEELTWKREKAERKIVAFVARAVSCAWLNRSQLLTAAKLCPVSRESSTCAGWLCDSTLAWYKRIHWSTFKSRKLKAIFN